MCRKASFLPKVFLIRTTVVLIIWTSVLAAGFYACPAANTSVEAASPFFVTCSPPCEERFDSVTLPALPAGWTATIATSQVGDLPWRTVNTARVSFPNSVFAGGVNHVSDNWLTSKTFTMVSSPATLTFSRQNSLEANFDGMVLEISIDGAPFVDILLAGGSFMAGGYDAPITIATNPIVGRAAWTGDTVGFVTTSVRLPTSANAQSVAFRWRVGTDHSVASVGAFLDNITLTEPPANDNFANAQPILGASGIIIGTNVGATKEPNEPNHANQLGAGSVWYRWQAPGNGRFAFTTVGSGSDTLLAVYTGSSLPGTLIVSNDDDPFACFFGARYSGVSFDAIGGTVYHIAVDTRIGSSAGNIRLPWGRNASISGSITDASLRPRGADTVQLFDDGHCYRRSDPSGSLLFREIPTGGNYSVLVQSANSTNFSPYLGNPSISPLTGSVTDLNFYQTTPAHSISGTVTIPGGDTSSITVTCASTPGNLISRPGSDLGAGKYQCSGLPVGADYVVTPAKLGFTFTPVSRTIRFLFENLFLVDFTGAAAPARTISGRVTSDGTTGVGSVSVALSGSQMGSRVTDTNGNYSFTGALHGGNYTITPSNTNLSFTPASRSFNNLSADQTANFTASFLLQLTLDELGQVAALDSSLLMRDPFPVINNNNLLNTGVDRNTRVTIFLANFQLGPTESASSVVINLVGSNSQSYDIPAEHVRTWSDPASTQVTFRLPDTLTAGICTLVVKARGLTSNMGAMKIR